MFRTRIGYHEHVVRNDRTVVARVKVRFCAALMRPAVVIGSCTIGRHNLKTVEIAEKAPYIHEQGCSVRISKSPYSHPTGERKERQQSLQNKQLECGDENTGGR